METDDVQEFEVHRERKIDKSPVYLSSKAKSLIHVQNALVGGISISRTALQISMRFFLNDTESTI